MGISSKGDCICRFDDKYDLFSHGYIVQYKQVKLYNNLYLLLYIL